MRGNPHGDLVYLCHIPITTLGECPTNDIASYPATLRSFYSQSCLTSNQAEFAWKFRWDLRDDVGREVAGRQGRVAHHEVDGVGHLHQLTVGEV